MSDSRALLRRSDVGRVADPIGAAVSAAHEAVDSARLSLTRIGSDGPAARAAGHIRGRGERCAFCHGYGDVVNPRNGDPKVKVTDWLAPVGCPRCGQTGKEPNP